jgi:hypothetical protein
MSKRPASQARNAVSEVMITLLRFASTPAQICKRGVEKALFTLPP